MAHDWRGLQDRMATFVSHFREDTLPFVRCDERFGDLPMPRMINFLWRMANKGTLMFMRDLKDAFLMDFREQNGEDFVTAYVRANHALMQQLGIDGMNVANKEMPGRLCRTYASWGRDLHVGLSLEDGFQAEIKDGDLRFIRSVILDEKGMDLVMLEKAGDDWLVTPINVYTDKSKDATGDEAEKAATAWKEKKRRMREEFSRLFLTDVDIIMSSNKMPKIGNLWVYPQDFVMKRVGAAIGRGLSLAEILKSCPRLHEMIRRAYPIEAWRACE